MARIRIETSSWEHPTRGIQLDATRPKLATEVYCSHAKTNLCPCNAHPCWRCAFLFEHRPCGYRIGLLERGVRSDSICDRARSTYSHVSRWLDGDIPSA